jgi:taurine transport system substrate-binding protein
MMRKTLTALLAGATMAMSAQAAKAMDELTVGYFLEWPMPFLAAKAEGVYEKELGMPIKWRSFDTGTAMSAAMASGDVHISVSQGLPPFVVAASSGLNLQVVDIAVSYSDNDNCVVSKEHGIDKSNAKELEGKRAAVPLGTAAHYGFLRQMDHFGVDITTVNVVDMPPADGAIALGQGLVDFACGWGGGLNRMKESGNILLTGAEKEDLGILVFDVTSTTSEFASENPEVLAKFLKVTSDTNDKYNGMDDKSAMIEVIANESGMDVDAATASLNTMKFPSRKAQLSEKWMDGGVQTFMKGVADVFVEAGSIDESLETYADTVNSGPLTAAK